MPAPEPADHPTVLDGAGGLRRGFAHGAMESDLSDGRPHAVLLVDEGVERSRFVKPNFNSTD